MILSAINSWQLERKLVDKPQQLNRYRGPPDVPQTPVDVPDSSRYRGPIDTPQVMTVGSDVGIDEPHPPNYYHIGSAADPGYMTQ